MEVFVLINSMVSLKTSILAREAIYFMSRYWYNIYVYSFEQSPKNNFVLKFNQNEQSLKID